MKQKVTVENFVRAETDGYFKTFVDRGGLGKFFHHRRPTPIDRQDVIRMNRDTLYSAAVFDLAAGPVTIHKPDTGDRFQSVQIISQDHFTPMVVYDPGRYTLTAEDIGTRYVAAIVRTFVDANDSQDVKEANGIQDQMTAEQASAGKFEIPDWDTESRDTIRNALNLLAATVGSSRNAPGKKGAFGKKGQVDPILHLLSTAYAWGGNPVEAATYINVVPEKNDGKTPHTLTVGKVPVDGFWSVTVYNKDGFMQKNDRDAYSFNDVTARRNQDGSITINFGRGPDAVNDLPVTPGWNYIVRLYRPRKEVLDGSWTFPQAQPAAGSVGRPTKLARGARAGGAPRREK